MAEATQPWLSITVVRAGTFAINIEIETRLLSTKKKKIPLIAEAGTPRRPWMFLFAKTPQKHTWLALR
jgi:hypothetical protein